MGATAYGPAWGYKPIPSALIRGPIRYKRNFPSKKNPPTTIKGILCGMTNRKGRLSLMLQEMAHTPYTFETIEFGGWWAIYVLREKR